MKIHFWNEWVYAHELAHQWWGDMITYESWHHTWLGEGFAVYSEALWYEHLYGPGGASEYQVSGRDLDKLFHQWLYKKKSDVIEMRDRLSMYESWKMAFWSDGLMEYWSVGEMEKWRNGVME